MKPSTVLWHLTCLTARLERATVEAARAIRQYFRPTCYAKWPDSYDVLDTVRCDLPPRHRGDHGGSSPYTRDRVVWPGHPAGSARR